MKKLSKEQLEAIELCNDACHECPANDCDCGKDSATTALLLMVQVETQQQEVEMLKCRLADIEILAEGIFRDINESDKVHIYTSRIKALCGTYGENATKILINSVEALRSEKDQQAQAIIRMDSEINHLKDLLNTTSQFLQDHGLEEMSKAIDCQAEL